MIPSENELGKYFCIIPIVNLQAYRLEPLVNSAYERIHPVRIDRSGAGPSEAAQELACGPRRDSDLVEPVKKGWMSYLPSIAKGSIAASEAVANASTGSASSDKKVLHHSDHVQQ